MTAPKRLAALLLVLPSLLAGRAVSGEIAPAEKRSGYAFSSRETQAMQDDDSANPAFLWVAQGRSLWRQPEGTAGKSCADCHGDAAASMTGVAARYPAFDARVGRLLDLEGRINQCRVEHQEATPLAYESDELLALTAFIAKQSRGVPMDVATEGPARPFFEAGRDLFFRREGQMNLSCSQCHDDNWGKRLAGNLIPQGHAVGYPIYGLEWQAMGSLRRRLRNCMAGVRAEPYPYDAPEYVDLELYLAWRAQGLPVETPAVRR
jgi:L-cysteine S-thiosulfotransferase